MKKITPKTNKQNSLYIILSLIIISGFATSILVMNLGTADLRSQAARRRNQETARQSSRTSTLPTAGTPNDSARTGLGGTPQKPEPNPVVQIPPAQAFSYKTTFGFPADLQEWKKNDKTADANDQLYYEDQMVLSEKEELKNVQVYYTKAPILSNTRFNAQATARKKKGDNASFGMAFAYNTVAKADKELADRKSYAGPVVSFTVNPDKKTWQVAVEGAFLNGFAGLTGNAATGANVGNLAGRSSVQKPGGTVLPVDKVVVLKTGSTALLTQEDVRVSVYYDTQKYDFFINDVPVTSVSVKDIFSDLVNDSFVLDDVGVIAAAGLKERIPSNTFPYVDSYTNPVPAEAKFMSFEISTAY